MSFVKNLIERIREKQSVVCMGLDPRIGGENQIPNHIIEQYDRDPNKVILEFNKELIENTHELIPIIKPQSAFYEKYDALDALKETIKYAHKYDLLVLLDAKRNDIGSTSEAYAHANFKVYGADACTINAYFGIDGVKPFLEYEDKGVFILVKTSNPSSSDFQNLFSIRLQSIEGDKYETTVENANLKRNYIQMAKLVNIWSDDLELYEKYCNLGVVVGATYPTELQIIRKIVPNSFFLIPGYGAQGGTAKDIKYGFDENGQGAVVNSSRGIMFAYGKSEKYGPERFAAAAREEIEVMNEAINKEINL